MWGFIGRLREKLGGKVSTPYVASEAEKHLEEYIQPLRDKGIIPEGTQVTELYIPYSVVTDYDTSARRHRDIESGKYISKQQYHDITRSVKNFNLVQALHKASPEMTAEQRDFVLDRYYYLAGFDQEQAQDYIRLQFDY